MMLNKLINPQFSRKTKKRVGRGPGSGLGKTAGKGHKGQRARSGYKSKAGFEGGQTPLHRRLPKKGFNNIHSKEWNIFNFTQLLRSEKLKDLNEINYEVLKNAGLIKFKNAPVKLLSVGEVKKTMTFTVNAVSKNAVTKVEEAGGKVILI